MNEYDLGDTRAPLTTHLRELRLRVLYCLSVFVLFFVPCYYFAEDIYHFLMVPLLKASGASSHRMIYTGLAEAFFSYLKLSVFAAFVFTVPFLTIQAYLFLAPGLYKREKTFLLPYFVSAQILFLIGAALAYYGMIPIAWKFFLSFETKSIVGATDIPIVLEAKISEYLSLVIQIVLAFGLSFQLPTVIVLLAHVGVLSPSILTKSRRHVIVMIFVIAAFLTPPDVISQIGLAFPLIVLYEISILICKVVGKEKDYARY
jgi:sec-independent protein translocase protein TatC